MHRIQKFLFSFFLIITLLLSGCSSSSEEPISATDICFDTIVSIKIWDTDDQKILDHCMQMCSDFENLFSRTLEGSEIYAVNHAQGQPVTVSDDTAELIRRGLEYSRLSKGKFDITIGTLSTLWDIKNNPGTIPDEQQIQEAISHVDYNKVSLDGNTVTLEDPETILDLGGIAKGYIADQLKSYLTSQGIKHAVISLGGNILTIGGKPDGSKFTIGIQKPFAEQNETITTLEVQDQSVVSSGNYERYFEKDGIIYHHILDPKTGYPYQNDLLEVTIVSDLSTDGDALSTICYALGLKKGMELINNTENVEAIFVTSDYALHYSDHLTP